MDHYPHVEVQVEDTQEADDSYDEIQRIKELRYVAFEWPESKQKVTQHNGCEVYGSSNECPTDAPSTESQIHRGKTGGVPPVHAVFGFPDGSIDHPSVPQHATQHTVSFHARENAVGVGELECGPAEEYHRRKPREDHGGNHA